MDRDFISQVVANNIGNPVTILERHPTISNQQALMVTLEPKFNLPREKPEIVFICDQSRSMAGESPNLQAALQRARATQLSHIARTFKDRARGAHLLGFEEIESIANSDCEDEPVRHDDWERPELGSIITLQQEIPTPGDDIVTWIKDLYLRSRGMGLRTLNRSLLSIRVIVVNRRFMAATLHSIYHDEQARTKVWSAILENMVQGYQRVMKQAMLLIDIEQRKRSYTLNRPFNAAVQKARGQRIRELLRPKARKGTKQCGELQYMGRSGRHPQGNPGLVMDRFIDSVFQLAVDHCLLTSPSSPLAGFAQE
ncbi:hypothetical protein DL767_010627 [Monosporascus sp. MG133]|nr:hypothetical protein DL767_010627 [Monosporascus sp. MG133]